MNIFARTVAPGRQLFVAGALFAEKDGVVLREPLAYPELTAREDISAELFAELQASFDDAPALPRGGGSISRFFGNLFGVSDRFRVYAAEFSSERLILPLSALCPHEQLIVYTQAPRGSVPSYPDLSDSAPRAEGFESAQRTPAIAGVDPAMELYRSKPRFSDKTRVIVLV